MTSRSDRVPPNFDYQELLNRIPKPEVKKGGTEFEKHAHPLELTPKMLARLDSCSDVVHAFIEFLTAEKHYGISCAGTKNGMSYELEFKAKPETEDTDDEH